ncbi:MAG: tetratricopeptide repeat protein [Myxococcales bacterium]|nr:tetratricopeptide repeat protein [Myxococcales bacterium]MDD9969237.1 tetratricopeptide repeat protein [Myxococcales bacterium]
MISHRYRYWVCSFLTALLLSTAVGCLKPKGGTTADEDDGKDFTVGRWAFRRLNNAETAAAQKKYDEALKLLGEMQANEDLNPHERALMWQQIGNIHVVQEDYPAAVKAFKKCVDLDALPAVSQAAVQFNLGQLYAITGDYKGAVKLLEAWLAKQKEEPSREIQLMLANAYVQMGMFKKALPYAEAVAKKTQEKDENLLGLLLAIRFELKNYEQVVTILTELVERFPKKAYWLQLSAAYSQLKDDRRALAVLELAYRQDMLTEESELRMLAQHYLHLEMPFEAATVLEKEMKAKRVAKSPKNLQLLSSAWMSAREVKKALKTLGNAAREAKDGTIYVQLGQLYMQEERWAQAQAALQKAIKKGGLKNAGTAHLLLGNASYELGKRSAARQAFNQAARHKKTKAAADRWLGVMQREDESCPTGKEAACKLIPGRS